jgi:HTH-type transcriptional regulator/antitoxin MqsA
MKCPNCVPTTKLVRDTRDLSYTYKGKKTVISSVTGDFCPACEEVILKKAESAQLSAAMLNFNKQVDARPESEK